MADIHRDSNRLGTFDIFENHDLLSKMIEDVIINKILG